MSFSWANIEKHRWQILWPRCGSRVYPFAQIPLSRIQFYGYIKLRGRERKCGPMKKKHGFRDAAPSFCRALKNLFLLAFHTTRLFCLVLQSLTNMLDALDYINRMLCFLNGFIHFCGFKQYVHVTIYFLHWLIS